MKTKKIKLTELKRPEKNCRIHSEKQIKEFIRSIEAFDQIRPIVTDENLTIICGNGLYDALLAMGKTEADVLIKEGLSENEKKKLMLADNKIATLGIDDIEVFESFLNDLGDDLDIPGYELDLLQTITAAADEIDEDLSGYGIITPEKKTEIEKTVEKYEAEEEKVASVSEEIKPVAAPVAGTGEEPPEPERLQPKYIVCPKCGERIWI